MADEAASVLQIDRQAVYVSLSAARKQLREKLSHYFETTQWRTVVLGFCFLVTPDVLMRWREVE